MTTISVGDAQLYYREAGTGSPLLLIHGTGGHADHFDQAAALLAHHHRVIVYDRRGHTRSGSQLAPARGYLRRQAEDAAAILHSLGATPATVVGWSMGGLIALCLSLEHPELVARVVVCEPPLHVLKHMNATNLVTLLRVLFLSAIGRKRAAVATFLGMTLRLPDGRNGYDNLDAATREGILANAEIILHELKAGTGEELTPERLQRLRCPISAILGAETHQLFADATDRLSKLLPQMPVTRVPGAGHLLVVSQPEEFARLALQS